VNGRRHLRPAKAARLPRNPRTHLRELSDCDEGSEGSLITDPSLQSESRRIFHTRVSICVEVREWRGMFVREGGIVWKSDNRQAISPMIASSKNSGRKLPK